MLSRSMARLGVEPRIAEHVLDHAQGRIAATYDVYSYVTEKRNSGVEECRQRRVSHDPPRRH